MKIAIEGKDYSSPAQTIVGRDLKKMRLKANTTTSIAAEYMGIKSRKTIENWEAGASSPSINQLVLLCIFYDFDASKVLKQCLHRLKECDPQEDYREIDFEACRVSTARNQILKTSEAF